MNTNKKVTPTGVLILSADAPREDWLKERTKGITATDLPTILGLNKYRTALDVWTDKVTGGSGSFEPAIGSNEAAFWGIQLEDVVAKAWAEQNGFSVRRVGIIAHEDADWQRASLDRLVSGCPDGKCALEVKTRSAYVGADWDAGVPADVKAQVLWQLHVSGLGHIHVIALIGGQRLVEHIVYGFTDIAEMIDAGKSMWDAVQSGQPPVLPAEQWTDAYLDAIHPNRDGETEVDTATMLTATEYEEVQQQIKILTERKDELKTKLVGALGEFESATWDGQPVYSYKSSTARRLDSKRLVEFYPDVENDERVWTVSTTRTLRVSNKKGNK